MPETRTVQTAQKEVFADLYDNCAHDLYRYAFHFFANADDAADAVQEAALAAYSGFPGLRDVAKFRAWMFRIFAVICRRKLRGIIAARETLPTEALDNVAALSSDIDLSLTLRESLGMLPETERELVLLAVVGGYKSREIADMLGMSPGSVRSKLSRTLAKLRANLAAE